MDQTNQSETPFIDAHCHLALGKEIIQIVNQDHTNQNKIHEGHNLETNTFYSLGYHPWNFQKEGLSKSLEKTIADCFESIQQKNIYIIGEIGLDRVHKETFEKQLLFLEGFLKQYSKLGLKLPIVFHCVRAYQDLYKLISESKIESPILLHDFNGNLEMIKQFSNLDCYFSLGSQLYQTNSKLYKSIQEVPLDSVLLETDDQTERSISDIYSTFGKLRNIDTEELKEIVATNFATFLSSAIPLSIEGLIS